MNHAKMQGPMAPKEKQDGGRDDWEAGSALDALVRAAEIQADKGLMARVRKVGKRREANLGEVLDDTLFGAVEKEEEA